MVGPGGSMMCPPTSCAPMASGNQIHSPMTPSSTQGGMTISTGPGSSSPHGSTHGSGSGTPVGPLSSGGGPGSAPPGLTSHQGPHSAGPPINSSSGPPGGGSASGMPPMSMAQQPGGVPMGPMSAPPHGMMGGGPGGPQGGMPPGPGGPGGMMNRSTHNPLSMSNEKLYPPGQSMVFNPQNPNAPPIYPCGNCRKEVHDNDQAILCESGCNFWYHRPCTGLLEPAFHFLTQDVYAEWVCDTCFKSKDVPLVKFKP